MYPALVVALREEWSKYEGKAARGVASATSGDRIKKLVTDALDKGAKNILPFPSSAASLPPGKVYPSILGGVTRKMRLYTEESFGPTLAIVAVPDEGRRETSVIHDLVQIANDTEYGLSAAVWGRDVARARAVARGIDAGAVHINTMVSGWRGLGSVRSELTSPARHRATRPSSRMEAPSRPAGDGSTASRACGRSPR